uniref:efflux RND transporter periplasmic adaptor subunit n=1 Tax=Oleiagrimonas sp. TaxID=2010330 RepID=UPI00261975D8
YDKVGTVDFSGTSVDPNTGSVQLRATIANPDHVLLPGMYVPVVLTMGHIDHAFLIPESAVQRNQKSAYVMVAGADGKAHQISVMTAGNQNHDWIVTSGIKDGDKVIVGGLANVHDGAAVKIASGSGGQTPRPVAATTAPAASAAKKKH